MKKAPLVLIAFFLPIVVAGETIPYGIPYTPGSAAPAVSPVIPGILSTEKQSPDTAALLSTETATAAPGDSASDSSSTEVSAADAPSSPDQSVVPVPKITALYSRSDFDGVIIAAGKSWYLEETDSLGRPSTATLWNDGSAVKVSTWLYYGSSQRAEKKIETTSDQSTETDYDKSGNVVLVEITASNGDIVSHLENAWDEKDLLVNSVFRKDKTVTRTEYAYTRKDGKDIVKEKKLFKNDELVSSCAYSDEDSWTETVFNKGKAILSVNYVKGERKGKHDEEKF